MTLSKAQIWAKFHFQLFLVCQEVSLLSVQCPLLPQSFVLNKFCLLKYSVWKFFSNLHSDCFNNQL